MKFLLIILMFLMTSCGGWYRSDVFPYNQYRYQYTDYRYPYYSPYNRWVGFEYTPYNYNRYTTPRRSIDRSWEVKKPTNYKTRRSNSNQRRQR